MQKLILNITFVGTKLHPVMRDLGLSLNDSKLVGERWSKVLREVLRIHTVEDLFAFFPYRYEDRSNIIKIGDLTKGSQSVQVVGTLASLQLIEKTHKKRLVGTLVDHSYIYQSGLQLVWFSRIDWILKSYKINQNYIAYGKVNWFMGRPSIVHPELELYNSYKSRNLKGIRPVYRSSAKLSRAGINSKTMIRLIRNAYNAFGPSITESLPEYILKEKGLIGKKTAFELIHFPKVESDYKRAIKRLKFEETFFLQMRVRLKNHLRKLERSGIPFKSVGESFLYVYHNKIDFEFTKAQKRVIKEIRRDMLQGYQMNRLVQGDVGSGKTIVALMSMLIAVDNGYQAILIAPTEILAQQHHYTIEKYLHGSEIILALLTGSTKAKRKKKIYEGSKNGKLQILVGTHAIIEDVVTFQKLGLVIIDEQQRFGVEQRSKLWDKKISNEQLPHILMMTATPIPRTLAQTYHGDLDISKIDEMPPTRKAVKTVHFPETKRMELVFYLKEIIRKGQQVFVVYPLIEESDAFEDIIYLEEGYRQIRSDFPTSSYRVNFVHGKMKSTEKEEVMKEFKDGNIDILLSTTVIEVGVDVPNATVMVIENAERFGLFQLHQLRGRVGRGSAKSYCFLVTNDKLSFPAEQRIKTMVATNDGFKISEVDMKIRGHGDLIGVRQSGSIEYKLADPMSFAEDYDLVKEQQVLVERILNEDVHLELPKNSPIKKELERLPKFHRYWSK